MKEKIIKKNSPKFRLAIFFTQKIPDMDEQGLQVIVLSTGAAVITANVDTGSSSPAARPFVDKAYYVPSFYFPDHFLPCLAFLHFFLAGQFVWNMPNFENF